MIPEKKPYFISDENNAKLKALMRIRTRQPINILITGKHGLGKSMLARQIAAHWKLDYVPVPICQLQEVGQLMGHLELVNGETRFVPSDFTKAIKAPNTVVHLEELNRPESPKALGELFPILDDARAIWHEHLGEVKVAPGVVFVGTLNEGFEYSGIDPMDEALRDRFFMIHLDYFPSKIEGTLVSMLTGLSGEVVDGILELVNKLRTNAKEPIHVSTRRMIMMAEMIGEGLGIVDSFKSCIGTDQDQTRLESVLIELDSMASKVMPQLANWTPKPFDNSNGKSKENDGFGLLTI